MVLTFVWFVAGLALLLFGASVLVHGASKLALSFGLSPLVVGLTVVAFGTSAPEMAVSVGAAYAGNADVAIGNVVGSNIFNVLVVLGLSAMVIPLAVHSQVIRQEMPILIGSALLLLVMGMDGSISRGEGVLLFVLLLFYTAFLVIQARRDPANKSQDHDDEVTAAVPGNWDSRWYVQLVLILAGLAMLVFGSDWLVSSAVVFARALGVSDLVIGLTVIAAGTSLPEVAASLAAAIKGERDMAVGNVIGSCVFNILGCVGLAAIFSSLAGLSLAPSLMNFDLWVMMAAFLACLPIFISGREIARWEGFVFFAYYVAYVMFLILKAQEHDALPAFSDVMLTFVVPITIITLVVFGIGSYGKKKHVNREA